MTDDRPTMCLECNTYVRLHHTENGTLCLKCDCGKKRTVKVSRKTPEGWA